MAHLFLHPNLLLNKKSNPNKDRVHRSGSIQKRRTGSIGLMTNSSQLEKINRENYLSVYLENDRK